MNKKTIIAIVILAAILAGGGFLMWQNSKAVVKDLNATLPDGVRVVKSMFGNEYKVVNKIDGYEFTVPKEWEGIEEIYYTPKESLEIYSVATLEIIGRIGLNRFASINSFSDKKEQLSPLKLAEREFETFQLEGDFQQETVGRINTVKTQENTNLNGMYVYFFEETQTTYAITNASEDYIRQMILTGKW